MIVNSYGDGNGRNVSKPLESFFEQREEPCRYCHSKLCKCKAFEELERRGWQLEKTHESSIYQVIFPNGCNVRQLVFNRNQEWNLILNIALAVEHGIDEGDQIVLTMEAKEAGMWDVGIKFEGGKRLFRLFKAIELAEALICIQTINELHEQSHRVDHSFLYKGNITFPDPKI